MQPRLTSALIPFAAALTALPALSQGPSVDLTRLVIVGDSLSAGFQNGSLMASEQPHGFAKLIAAQAGVELDLPLIAEPGVPNALFLVDPGPPPVLGVLPGLSPGRVDPTTQAFDLAVPGHDVHDALRTRPDLAFDDLTDLVLGLPGLMVGVSRSQVEWAEALAPTTVLVWVGNNDVLQAVLHADAGLVTPLAEFAPDFTELMQRLGATGATIVVATIPDATVIPYLTTAEQVAASVGVPLAALGPLLGIGPGDYVIPDAFELIPAILSGVATGPLPPGVVLDVTEVASVRALTAQMNTHIAMQAAAQGAVLVDTHALLNAVAVHGVVVGGQLLTTDFLGGIFSLDGVHPTRTGQAIVANAVIHALNQQAGAGIPPIALVQVAAHDPLVLPGAGTPPGQSKPVMDSVEAAGNVRATIGG